MPYYNENLYTGNTTDAKALAYRLDELIEIKQDLQDAIDEARCVPVRRKELMEAETALQSWDEEDIESDELEELLEVEQDIRAAAENGNILISENYFVAYIRELCEERGEVNWQVPEHIRNNVDWDGVADDLRQDYGQFRLRGTEWLYLY